MAGEKLGLLQVTRCVVEVSIVDEPGADLIVLTFRPAQSGERQVVLEAIELPQRAFSPELAAALLELARGPRPEFDYRWIGAFGHRPPQPEAGPALDEAADALEWALQAQEAAEDSGDVARLADATADVHRCRAELRRLRLIEDPEPTVSPAPAAAFDRDPSC